MTNYTKIKFDASEKVAITVTESGDISQWNTRKTDNECKVFANKHGNKAILYRSNWSFEDTAKRTPYCLYQQLWYGEFPYGSWSWAISKCLVTNEVKISTLFTSINSRGLSDSEFWEKECKSYVPESIVADLIAN